MTSSHLPGSRCARTLPLYAFIGRRTARVGQIPAGVTFNVAESLADGTREVSLRHPAAVISSGEESHELVRLRLLPSASLRIREHDFAECGAQGS